MGQDIDKDFGLKPATAIGYSIVSNLGGDRQMTVQCFVGEDEAEEVINSRIDKVFKVLDRQKAKYDLDKLESEFEELGRHLHNFIKGLAMAEQTARHQVAVLNVKLGEQQMARRDVYEEGYQKHLSQGRKGTFVPGGALQSRLNGMDIDIQKTKDAIAAAPADAAQSKAQVAENIYKYQDDMKKRRAAINELRKMAGRDELTLFMGEQIFVVE
jgi:hypothetical protein